MIYSRTITQVEKVKSFEEIPAVLAKYTGFNTLVTLKVEEYDTEYDLILSWQEKV